MLKRTSGQYASPGFTIVELLIVVVVIAILAAITIVSFNGIQNRSHDTAVQSELRTLGGKISQYYLQNNDTYPLANAAQLGSFGVKVSRNSYGGHMLSGGNYYNLLYCYNNTTGKFALLAGSRTGNTYEYIDGSVRSRSALLGGSASMCDTAGVDSTGRVVFWLYGHGGTDAWSTWI